MGHIDYTVIGTPEACVARLEQHLRDNWPRMEDGLPTGVSIPPLMQNSVQFYKARRTLLDSPAGLVAVVLLSLITLGSFALLYAFYYFVFRSTSKVELRIVARISGPQQTTLTVETDNPDYAKKIEEFIQRDLIENRSVAWSAEEAADSKDIPDQIQALAKLKDEGVITPEQFEAKRSELLNRM